MFIAVYTYTDADSSQAIQPEKTALKQSVCASNVAALSTQLVTLLMYRKLHITTAYHTSTG